MRKFVVQHIEPARKSLNYTIGFTKELDYAI